MVIGADLGSIIGTEEKLFYFEVANVFRKMFSDEIGVVKTA